MTEQLTPAQFHAAEGVTDWRVLAFGASAYFRTGSFAKGVELVEQIGRLAEAAEHHPDVDLRYPGITVRLMTHDAEMGLTERDLALARQISEAARSLGITADPTALLDVNIAIDAHVHADVIPFWSAVLGYTQVGDEDLVDPQMRWSGIWFQEMDVPRTERNRIHVDVFVPIDQARARIAAAVAAGGRVVNDANAPMWWTLADTEGNEVDVATMEGRG